MKEIVGSNVVTVFPTFGIWSRDFIRSRDFLVCVVVVGRLYDLYEFVDGQLRCMGSKRTCTRPAEVPIAIG